jgi:putative ATP-dependent endonuclease of the OLD family
MTRILPARADGDPVRLPAALYDLSMRLASLRVEGYSGIRAASLDLEPDITALIGENDCGKGRLLETLGAVLGGEPDRGPPSFGGGPATRVELGFEEREPGEWDTEPFGPIHASLPAEGPAPRRLTLEAGEGSWALVGPGGSRRSEPDLLAWLRRQSPVISLRRATWMRPDDRVREGPADLQALVDEVLGSASDLLDGTAADPERELERGFAAAAEVIARAQRYLDPERPALHPVVAEVMGHMPDAAGPHPPGSLGSGTSAERIGVLYVVAGLLKEIGRPFDSAAEPILVVEDLEAYMHVMTLAAAMRLVARIRWQRILTTNSSDLLGEIPLRNVRRLVRHEDVVYESRIEAGTLSPTDLRRVTYHLRARRGQAMFARCWLLVEGESEAWLLPELARLCGYELAQEGVALVEFAQSGLGPAIRTAAGLGIEWHVLTDGDEAGEIYRALAQSLAGDDPLELRVTALREPDLELFLWHHGYSDIYRRVANARWGAALPPRRIVRKAIEKGSKPMLALEVLSAIAERGEAGVPPPLRALIETCVTLAREAPARQAARRRGSG